MIVSPSQKNCYFSLYKLVEVLKFNDITDAQEFCQLFQSLQCDENNVVFTGKKSVWIGLKTWLL